MNSISADLNLMIKAATKASKVLIRDFGEIEKLQVSLKGPSDFVTNADLKVEKIIIDELLKSKKKYSFITEESGKIQTSDNVNCWIIDPIDGTINFLHGVPHFAISIALKKKDEIIAGVVYDPIKDEMFYAEKNNGAYLNNKRIKVSKKNNLIDCLLATGNEYELNNLTTRNMGCAALDMAYVAAGRFDGYFQDKLNLWDLAAGIILVNEAGGKINNININKIENIKILATNNSIYEKMLKKLNNF